MIGPRGLEALADDSAVLVHPPAVDLFPQGHLALETGDDFAGVKGEGPDTVTSADGV
ncbi:hypothetical protein K3A88_29940 [Streptomyces geysiriensis]|nr:hypothetical protein [Streptomyces geysiriensis]